MVYHINCAENFLLQLVLCHKYMRVVLREISQPEEPGKHPAKLVAMDLPEFGQAHRKIAVTAGGILENQYSASTVHGLDPEINVIYLCPEHVFPVVIPVSAYLPEDFVHNKRREYFLVAALHVLLSPEFYQLIPDNHALRMEERHARSLFLQAVQVEQVSQNSVVVRGQVFLLLLLLHLDFNNAFFLFLGLFPGLAVADFTRELGQRVALAVQ